MATSAGRCPNLRGIKYVVVLFGHNHSLTKPTICAKFVQNRCFALYGFEWFPR